MRVAMILSNGFPPDPRPHLEARALAKEHEVSIFCWDREGRHPPREERDGIALVRSAVPGSYGTVTGLLRGLPGFYRDAACMMRGLGPWDVVHCHDFDTLPLGHRVARRMGARLVYDSHEHYSGRLRRLFPVAAAPVAAAEAHYVRRADAVVVVNHFLKDYFLAKGARRVELVPNTKPLADFERVDPTSLAALRRSWGAGEGDVVVSYVGVLIPDRNLANLVEAVAQVDGVKAVIGGTGPLLEELRRKAEADPSRFVFLGNVPPHEIPAITLASDVVFCCYSAANPNNLYGGPPNKLFEAIAAQKPCIVTNVGVTADLVRRLGNGLTVDGSTASLREAIARLARRDREYDALREAARGAREEYNWERTAQRLRALYAELAPA